MQVAVILEKSENGYAAYAPEVPGCVAAGDTREETLQLMQEALEFHFQAMVRDSDPLPEVTGVDCAMLDVPLEKMLAERSAA
ncbi:type II toxin-antitoxin system HicB family antitoxin [bacterium CPR1]|nr:type II toxin-antitoxin system HicB family antitoxin [bacterium CPR1]